MLGIAMPRRGYRYRPYRLSEHNLLVALRTAACRQQLGLCYWCGEPMIAGDVEPTDPKLCTADHLVPQYAGMAREPGGVLAELVRLGHIDQTPRGKRSARRGSEAARGKAG